MAVLNKVMLIGRLCNDPETRTFPSGGKIVSFRFAVTNRKKNQSTGAWEDEPMFIDCKIFGGKEGSRLADLFSESCRKGHQVFLEARLVLEQWDDKNGGGKRSKHVLVVENFQFLEKKGDGNGAAPQQSRPAQQTYQQPPDDASYGSEADIPF